MDLKCTLGSLLNPKLNYDNYYCEINKILVYYPLEIIRFENIVLITYEYCHGYFEYYYHI